MKFSAARSLALWRKRLAYRETRVKVWRRRYEYHPSPVNAKRLSHWKYRVTEAKLMVAKRRYQATAVHERAYRVAAGLVGVMEEGGNNRGTMVMKIIQTNGGSGPEPWCGDFVAYCYRLAGSKTVTRSWASVRLLGGVTGVRRTVTPKRGDLVRFTFDHVGMYVRDCSDGTIETVEGNTGSSGAVSDSKTGDDGVYRKRRAKSLVNDYLRVTR